ncbi:hypothetical protein B0H13DRAFT_1895404 [Mycena leptocephala]|nr:hypothetical protein B0H13DRAFT_1895404 [Mycena leptocephala]
MSTLYQGSSLALAPILKISVHDGTLSNLTANIVKTERPETPSLTTPREATDPIAEAESIAAEDVDDSSSSFDNMTRNGGNRPSPTPPPPNCVLIRSKSTPQLRVLLFAPESHPHPHYPHVVQLHTLAKKLGKVLPLDKAFLYRLIPDDLELHERMRGDDFFMDPGGLPPSADDMLIHVFIDDR